MSGKIIAPFKKSAYTIT